MKQIEYKYTKCRDGIIYFVIKSRRQIFKSSFFNTFDSLDEYIYWLEDILDGKDNVEYIQQYESCPYPFSFKYENGYFTVNNANGVDYEKNCYIYGEKVFEIKINKDRLVYEFYYSFRKFIESRKYDSMEWEYVEGKDFFEIKYKNVENGYNSFYKMKHKKIMNLLNKYEKHEREYTEYLKNNEYNQYYDSKYYDNCNMKQKKEFLDNYFINENVTYDNGLRLRNLVSDKIEKYFNKYGKYSRQKEYIL